jgi:hypothetical protein
MRNKKKERKAKIASNKVLLASVTEEMAQPRMTASAKIKSDKRSKLKDGTKVPRPAAMGHRNRGALIEVSGIS